MFVDASALVAILTDERSRPVLLDCLDQAFAPVTSALAVFETVTALSRKKAQSIAASEAMVADFLTLARVRIVAIGDREGVEAIAAFSRFGKGQGHPAQLNMGDCFAYACARVRGAPLLFIGNDFSRTDIVPAVL